MSHAPKLRALEAYAVELLSTPGRARLERHLGSCPRCREALDAVRSYALLREEATSGEVPLLGWERLEAALEASEREPALANPSASPNIDLLRPQRDAGKPGMGKVIAMAWPLLAVAATLAIVWLGVSGNPPPQVARTPTQVSVPNTAPTPAFLVGHVSLLAGAVTLEVDGAQLPLRLGSEVREGARLITSPGASVHIVVREGTGFALSADTNLRVAELRANGVQLELAGGSVASQVHKLAADERYEVHTRELSARVRGTRFEVQQQAGAQRVFVSEGKVEVARGDQVLALLTPGQSYESGSPGKVGDAVTGRKVHGTGGFSGGALDAGSWGTLELPALGELHAWIVAGERVAPQGGLSMRLPRGPTELTFEDARGQIRSVSVDLREAVTTLDPSALAKLVAPKEVRTGHLEPEQIRQVIKAAVDPLRRCYERGLRVVPTLAGKLTLSVRVAADGHVTRAEPKGDSALPVEVSRCISQEASRLLFPKPEGGAGLSFDVPLNLKTH